MNCIFITIFNNTNYVKMFYLLLESIYIFGNLNNDTDILIYTSTSFMNIIKKSHLFSDKIKFEINDNYNNIDKACKARLDLFKLQSTNNYNKILYLDTDILIKSDINEVFDSCKLDILYTLEEGTIDNDNNFWGKILFKETIENYTDKKAFTSGILLFNNCEQMKKLFDKINDDMISRPYNFYCRDQPYIVYNAFKYNIFNNQILKSFAVNNDHNIHSDKVIHHFPGDPGIYSHKILNMTKFLQTIKEFRFLNMNNTLNIEHDIWTCSSKMRKDIADFFVAKKHFKIAEIGSHKGYTTKVLSKLFTKVFAVDNNIAWTNFNKNFNKDATNIEYIHLDIYKESWDILPSDIEVVFIDADHSYNGCKNDIINSLKRFKNLQYIIFDDYGVWNGVKQIIDEYMNNKTLIFERFIGINDVPGPNGIIKHTNEGIICRVNKEINEITNKTYTWENSTITFLDNFKMDAFGNGFYTYINKHEINAEFGGRVHFIQFNDDYTTFSSTRKDDLQIVNGCIFCCEKK